MENDVVVFSSARSGGKIELIANFETTMVIGRSYVTSFTIWLEGKALVDFDPNELKEALDWIEDAELTLVSDVIFETKG
jgi:hypothetical protein